MPTISDNHKNANRRTYNLAFIAAVAALGGFLFGFDTAVISGTIDALRDQFHLSSFLEGWVVSSALLGCIAGALSAGSLSDLLGRKKILMVAAGLFLISAVSSAAAQTVTALICARLIGGLGVGMASMLSPLYISEFSPAPLRGRMVSLYQFAIVIGILAAYFSNSVIVSYASHQERFYNEIVKSLFVFEIWRGMFFMEAFPAVAFLALIFFIPESPRWLAKQGRTVDAVKHLSRVLETREARREIEELTALLDCEEGNLKELLHPALRVPLCVGLLLPFFSQVTAINVIIYYGTSIFTQAGLGSHSAFGAQVVIGCINVVFTLIAIWKVDQFGRKPLLLIGASGLTAVLLALGLLFGLSGDNASLYIMFLLFLHVAIFSLSWGPVTWIIMAEIFPTKIRGRALAIATFVIWISCALVAHTFPWFRDNLGAAKTFFVYAVLLMPSVLLIQRMLPETKGKTLEEIEQFWNLKPREIE